MILKQLNDHSCKTYLLTEQNTNEIILIDPVLDHVNDYISMIDKAELKLTHVIETHTHADHISGSAAMKDRTGCAYIMHEKSPVKCSDIRVSEGSVVKWRGVEINVIATPGHTKDSISLIIGNYIFTGDALFLDESGAGRDDLPGGDPGEHWETLQKFYKLPENLLVHPAHDYRKRKPSTLGQQKKTNPHLKPRTKEEFIQYLEDLKLGPADWMKDVLKANYSCASDPSAAWIPVDLPSCEVKGTLDIGTNEQQVTPITVVDLKKRIDQGDKFFFLDVREPFELKDQLGHIMNSVNIPIGTLSKRFDVMNKEDEIIVICRSGSRAYTAAQILQQEGFSSVKVMKEGMIGWNSHGYFVEK